jgi:hypothetical protein
MLDVGILVEVCHEEIYVSSILPSQEIVLGTVNYI